MTADANAAASKTKPKEQFIGKVMKAVQNSAKQVLGPKTLVLKAGSLKKHTDIATSDLDIYLEMTDPMTRKQKGELTEDLRKNVGKRVRKVQERAKSIKLFGANGMLGRFRIRRRTIKKNRLCEPCKQQPLEDHSDTNKVP